jgi:hypothetical protein
MLPPAASATALAAIAVLAGGPGCACAGNHAATIANAVIGTIRFI